jgi:hypothetical protein
MPWAASGQDPCGLAGAAERDVLAGHRHGDLGAKDGVPLAELAAEAPVVAAATDEPPEATGLRLRPG